YLYPFINCTNCGPRFTIVQSIPYDRAGTSMARFQMCPECQAEYDDPRSRRFHAQPNACWKCGPQLEFWSNEGQLIDAEDPIAAAADALHSGKIVAVKGLGGFHLAADALNASAVKLLRERKRRVEKPFAVMVPDLNAAEELCYISTNECAALQSLQRPIVLLCRREDCEIPEQVAPFSRELGLFMPYTPLHHLLFAKGGFSALVMTSGNASEEPIAIDNDEARERLGALADFFLVHNRDILLRCDDSVVRVAGNRATPLRRSRGFTPSPVFLHKEVPSILAVGGELKNTACLTTGKQAFLSQHIGDLENLSAYSFLDQAIHHLEHILEIEPVAIAHDLHPGYLSTQWAVAQRDLPLVGVQHHHAHIAGCMAENHLDGKVIGFALDGTGFGTDGHIWGGEVLVADYTSFERAAHFTYMPMPGGEAAIREPWGMAVSYLAHHTGRDFLEAGLPFLEAIDPAKINLVLRMLERQINSPLTSSCGRLCDAVASIAGIRQKVNYEGQAAIELEMAMNDATNEPGYDFELIQDGEMMQIGTGALFQSLIRDVSSSVPAGIVSARFHRGLVDILARVAHLSRERTGLDRVCLSGGTFNNVFILRNLAQQLSSGGFRVFTHNLVPCGDGGLSLGQAMVAAHRCHV
ncbi:MAG TPA: carbamoyltransferase HypF, partial [Terracidiphilus sp.]|nr:carbamoyltransferase HypF [Terracidiphilus sp.]